MLASLTGKKKAAAAVEDDDDIVLKQKQRLEKEARRIQEETAAKRKAKMRELVGDQAETIGDRKHDVTDHLEQWAQKGQGVHAPTDVVVVMEQDVVSSRKVEYQKNLERFTHKGKEHLEGSDEKIGELSADLQASFNASGNTPSLFAYDPVLESQSPRSQKAAVAAKVNSADPAKLAAAMEALRPANWDGATFHSLVDLRQRRVEGIDMNREQYLSPEEFQKAFGMTKEEFAVCPKWKRDKLKAAIHLF